MTPNFNYFLVHNRAALAYKDQYKLFTSRDKAMEYAESLGLEDDMGMASLKTPGRAYVYMCGAVDVLVIPLEMNIG